MKTIQYGLDLGTGLVWSRVGSEIAVPILDYDAMGPKNNFGTGYYLEKTDTSALFHATIKWTRKISKQAKNTHRAFWGFKLLK